MAEDPKTPVEQALDLAVYAPMGLALTAAEELPKLIERGRAAVEQQVVVARMMGKFAVAEGQKDLGRRLKDVAEVVGGLIGALVPPEPQAPARPPAAPAPAKPRQPAPTPSPEVLPEATVIDPGGSRETSSGAGNGSSPSSPAPDPSGLAIPGYTALSASQVVQRLDGLSTEQLEEVREYETATRGRKTILGRVAQLQQPSQG